MPGIGVLYIPVPRLRCAPTTPGICGLQSLHMVCARDPDVDVKVRQPTIESETRGRATLSDFSKATAEEMTTPRADNDLGSNRYD